METHIPPDRREAAALLDYGTGDASTITHLISSLLLQGIDVRHLGLVDIGKQIFSSTISTALGWMDGDPSRSIYLIEGEQRVMFAPRLDLHEDVFDAINLNLVLHQISNDAEFVLFLCRAVLSLRNNGVLLITDLSPEYIQYLMNYEPDKFTVRNTDSVGTLDGTYRFDSGGQSFVRSRGLKTIVSELIGIGFKLVEVRHPSLEPILNVKPRYRNLHEAGIPMFYTLVCQKGEDKFLSYSEGVVGAVTLTRKDNVRLTFQDRDEIVIPKISDWEKLTAGERVVLLEILLPDRRVALTMCVLPINTSEQVWKRVMIATNEN